MKDGGEGGRKVEDCVDGGQEEGEEERVVGLGGMKWRKKEWDGCVVSRRD